MSRFSSISSNPLVHVAIAAFIGAVVVPLVPALQDGFQSSDLSALNIALGAGVGAVIRALALAVPTKA